jgi:hypothetical protein
VRASSLYEALRASQIPYSNEPWNPASSGAEGKGAEGKGAEGKGAEGKGAEGKGAEGKGAEGKGAEGKLAPQRIRGPNETFQGPATCLDLALVFAGMALAADIRPLIGIAFGLRPHALVILDVQTALSEREAQGTAPAGFAEDPGVPGVWSVKDAAAEARPAFVSASDERAWRIVDVSLAARRNPEGGGPEADGVPYPEAVWDISQLLTDAGKSLRWTLADVVRVRTEQVGRIPYTPPVGRSIPAIHGYLPALPAFTEYPTRVDFLRLLRHTVAARQPRAVVVLQGAAGLGKSMLAHRLAEGADNGCGWFLNATDAKMLTTSLAQAEREEKAERGELAGAGAGTRGEKPDPGDDRALAAAALERLREAERPWVVVLDNCDGDPGAPGLAELVPQPRQPGQFVIITTKDPGWLEYAGQHGWQAIQLPLLTRDDLDGLGLPRGLDDAIAGTPLIAQALAALRDRGTDLPESAGRNGPGLVWNLLRTSQRSPRVSTLAQLLAWCPPEPMDVPRLLAVAGLDARCTADRELAALRFATPASSVAGQASQAIQMHRLLAAAVREWTWANEPATAARLIDSLLTSDEGRDLFIGAADTTALGRLEHGAKAGEPGDVARAANFPPDGTRAGLLWHGLGYLRERLGPVSASGPHFARATSMLAAARYPFQLAESQIGQARVVYQTAPATNEELIAARAMVQDARRTLEPLTDLESRQLREQGNALAWLITQRVAGRERDPALRGASLTEVRENLWQSYERRRRMFRPKHNAPARTPPEPEDKLGSERAYYNLAGVNIQLAKVHHELATKAGAADTIPGQVAVDLRQAAEVYAAARTLRERRYNGRAHPHLAACVHGQALVAYFRAVLLGETGQLADAFRFAAEAMEQRRKVASGLAGPDSAAVLRDPDMRKSVDFMLKASMVAILGRDDQSDRGMDAVRSLREEALAEWTNRPARRADIRES